MDLNTITSVVEVASRAEQRDGTLTALQLRVVSNSGAYGNHASTVFRARGESVAVYRCANKKVDGYSVYTNTVPSGAYRGYGLSQTIFAVESAIDELARKLDMDPVAFRERNVIRPGDHMVSFNTQSDDVEIGSYGLDQCLAVVGEALRRGNGVQAPTGEDWLVGQGMALGMIYTIPPRGRRADARVSPLAGRVINPMQCCGQIEGGIAQAVGAAMYESLVLDEDGQRHYGNIPRLPYSRIRRRATDRGVLRRDG
jgi:CO/xanthine dehydrogenase Mo-binding subunit